MTLSQLGEFGLIDLIRSIAVPANSERTRYQEVLVGIGDDATAWQTDNHIQLATTDTMVQDIHFDLTITGWEELGWKALAVNLSDIAAMGGVPKYALLSLALPSELEVEDISKFTSAMVHLAREFGVALVGGNVATSPNVVITVTLIGYSDGETILRRSTASPGEQIAVTGYLGLSAAGLVMLRNKLALDNEARTMLRQAHLQPVPRVREGQVLVEQGVRTAIDLSDGLLADLDHICESSTVNAKVTMEQVPVHPLLKANFSNHQELALCGGEDYELLFVADQATIARAKQALDCPVSVIGEITKERLATRVTVVDSQGNTVPYRKGGWEHFRNGAHEARIT
ncbi:MAG: thiamine-phosphate kinase [Dehalococcoidia bacterium]